MNPSLPPPSMSNLDAAPTPPHPSTPLQPPPPPVGGHPADLAPPATAPAPPPTTPAPPVSVPAAPAEPAATAEPQVAPPPTPVLSSPAVEQPARALPLEQMPPADPPQERRTRRSFIALLVVAIAAGLVGWWFLGRDDSSSQSQPPAGDPDVVLQAPPVGPSRDAGPTDAPQTELPPVRPIVPGEGAGAAIQDAQDLADAINADQGEGELLEELGLDPTGEPLPAAPGSVGHEFSWTFADGVTATIVVDTVTGDHSYVDSTGLSFRKVGELAFGQPAADQPWAMIDDSQLTSIQRLGLDRPLTVDDLAGGPVAAHASVSGDGSIWSIDEAAFQAADAAGRDAWVSAVGLPAESPAGVVTIWISTGADGTTVSTASIERESTGETVTYQLARLFDQSPAITAPEL